MGFYYTAAAGGWTPIAHADGASALANASYHALRNGVALDVTILRDLVITGGGTVSAVNEMAVRRTSTLSSTPTNIAPGKLSPNAPSASPQTFVAASTGPTLASTQHCWDGDVNVLGGVIRMGLLPEAGIWMMGVTQPNAELVLDAVTGTGVVTTLMTFETP